MLSGKMTDAFQYRLVVDDCDGNARRLWFLVMMMVMVNGCVMATMVMVMVFVRSIRRLRWSIDSFPVDWRWRRAAAVSFQLFQNVMSVAAVVSEDDKPPSATRRILTDAHDVGDDGEWLCPSYSLDWKRRPELCCLLYRYFR